MADADLLAVCGRFCGHCVWFLHEKTCTGCVNHSGNPGWGRCRVFQCVEGRDVAHCGLCDEFPCDLLMSYFDPGNPEGARNAAIRAGVCAYRAKHGDSETLEYFRKVGRLNVPRQSS